MTIIGYARVSTDGQTLTAQQHDLRAAGADSVFAETASGARSDRKELARALKGLQPGDTLLVTRLDRLARSTRDLLNILDAVAKVGAGFRSLHDQWADTTTPHGRLMLTVLGGLSQSWQTEMKGRSSKMTSVPIQRVKPTKRSTAPMSAPRMQQSPLPQPPGVPTQQPRVQRTPIAPRAPQAEDDMPRYGRIGQAPRMGWR